MKFRPVPADRWSGIPGFARVPREARAGDLSARQAALGGVAPWGPQLNAADLFAADLDHAAKLATHALRAGVAQPREHEREEDEAGAVGAGVILADLAQTLASRGQWYPPAPTYDGATIGGTIAAGNTIVLKPPSQTPLTALAIADMAHQSIVSKKIDDKSESLTQVVKDFDGDPFIGPNSLCLSSDCSCLNRRDLLH